MTSKAKAKGSGYERDVAKFLTETYGESFVRVHSSGAFVGGKNVVRKASLSEAQHRNFKGDVIPGPSFPLMNIEAKFYSDFGFHLLYNGDYSQLEKWLEQLMDVAEPHDLNMAFMKFNRKGQFIAVEKKHGWNLRSYMTYSSTKYGEWVIAELSAFFNPANTVLVRQLSSGNQFNHGSTDTTSNQNSGLNILGSTDTTSNQINQSLEKTS